MPAGGGHLDGAAEGVLALDLGEVPGGSVGRDMDRDNRGMGDGRNGEFSFEKTHGLIEGRHRIGFDALDEGGFVGGGGRKQDAAFAELFGEAGEGEGAPHRAGGPGEAEFAGDEVVVDCGRLHLLGGEQDAEGDGQVVERPLLAQVAGGEVDRGADARGLEAAVAERGHDAVIGFLDGGVGEADEDEFGIPAFAGVDLHVNQFRIDALQGGGRDRREHGGSGGREGVAAGDHAEIVFDGVDVGVAAVGTIKKAIHAQKIVIEFGLHDLFPENTGSVDQLVG